MEVAEPPKQLGLASGSSGSGKAAFAGAACVFVPPVKDSCASPPVTLQHCLLSSWCSWAKLESETELEFVLLNPASVPARCGSSRALKVVTWKCQYPAIHVASF